jgi:hypothetical protein
MKHPISSLLTLLWVSSALLAEDNTITPALPSSVVKQPAPIQIAPKITPREFKPPSIPVNLGNDVIGITGPKLDGVIDLFGGPENLRLALAATKVELVELKLKKGPTNTLESDEFSEGRRMVLTPEDAEKLRTLLTKDSTYEWDESPDCVPIYSYRVKFCLKEKLLCVDLGLDCKMLRVVKDNRAAADVNFKYGYEAILLLVASYFPRAVDQMP